MACLLKAYPSSIKSAGNGRIVFHDGTTLRYDDKKTKSHKLKLRRPDLEDSLSQRYKAGAAFVGPPAKNHEPGRIRYLPFFKKMYGATKRAVARQLVSVRWMPKYTTHKVRVSKTNGVHKRLEAVSARLQKLGPSIRKLLTKTPGTFAWRYVRGTKRLSAHSFGIAVDVAVSRANYWRWDRPAPDGTLRYRNRIPMKVVQAFEAEGFIWGGKWYHYDTMHFEYRPELLVRPCVINPPKKKKGGSP